MFNNGKTLSALFSSYPSCSISQLFFGKDNPDYSICQRYYRVTDEDVIKSIVSKNKNCGSDLSEDCKKVSGKLSSFNSRFFRTSFFRGIRELIWAIGSWKSESLIKWLDDQKPEVVFFLAGDSCFAYSIAEYICDRYSSKLIVYLTDDYILPRRTLSPFWWIKRWFLVKKMKEAIGRANQFITISEEMRSIYRAIFNKDSCVFLNMSQSMKINYINPREKDYIELIYAGGLHLNRWKTIRLLSRKLEIFNQNYSGRKKVLLKIYTSRELDKKIRRKFEIEGTCVYSGRLNGDQLRIALNMTDIAVHVESFDSKSIESTRLSISTKIPEYLSLGKPILAIGPGEISSMIYLDDAAFIIKSPTQLQEQLEEFIFDEQLLLQYAEKAKIKYSKFVNSNKCRLKLLEDIIGCSTI